MTDQMKIDRMELARNIIGRTNDESAIVLLYAIDLALFNGENIEYSTTVDRQAKDLLVDVITGGR